MRRQDRLCCGRQPLSSGRSPRRPSPANTPNKACSGTPIDLPLYRQLTEVYRAVLGRHSGLPRPRQGKHIARGNRSSNRPNPPLHLSASREITGILMGACAARCDSCTQTLGLVIPLLTMHRSCTIVLERQSNSQKAVYMSLLPALYRQSSLVVPRRSSMRVVYGVLNRTRSCRWTRSA